MTDYTEAAKQLAWENCSDASRFVYLERAAKAAAVELAEREQREVVARAIWQSDVNSGLVEDEPFEEAADRNAYLLNASAAIAAYVSTVPKQDATTQGRISYG